MARPAGFSSDEDFSDDELSFADSPPARKQGWLHFTNTKTENISKEKELVNAVIDNNVSVVDKLLSEGVGSKEKSKVLTEWNALMHACSIGTVDMVTKLLDHKLDPNCHHELFTPLMAICDSTKCDENALLECVELLLNRGADPKARDWFGTNSLMYAVKRGHQKIVLKLLSLGIDVNEVDKDGWSPLFYAVDSGNLYVVQILKDIGGDVSLIDKRGRTLYDIAIMKDYKDISEIVTTKDKIPSVDEIVEQKWEREQYLSSYRFVLAELPDKKKGRFSGYSTDAIKIIHGIGLNNLTSLFLEKNIQLGELLTNTDDQWKQLGISMSFDRDKIRYSVQKFHERHWGKLSIGSGVDKDDITLFSVSQVLSTLVRQLYVLSTTTYFLNANIKDQTNGVLKYVEKALNHLDRIEKEILLKMNMIGNIERAQNIVPADLIINKNRRSYLKHILSGSLICGLILYGVIQTRKFSFSS